MEPLEVKAAHGYALVGGKLELLGLLRGRNSCVFILAAKIVLDDVKRLLVDIHVLMRLQELNLVQTCPST